MRPIDHPIRRPDVWDHLRWEVIRMTSRPKRSKSSAESPSEQRAAAQRLNKQLGGSPYSLPLDQIGLGRAYFLEKTGVGIERRFREVAMRFARESAAVQAELDAILSARSVYETNALEYAGLDLKETESAMREAPNSMTLLSEYIAKRMVHADPHLIEVLGVRQANLFAKLLAQDFHSHRPILEVDIRDLHRFTLPLESLGGMYRTDKVTISGSSHEPPPYYEVPRQMQELVVWINHAHAPAPLAAAVVHSWLTVIHPFHDGNGRMARLLANIVLMRARWPPLVVSFTDRLQYLDALAASDDGGDILPVYELFLKSVERSLKDLEDPALGKRLYQADIDRVRELRYQTWSDLITEFIVCLRKALRDVGLVVDRLAVPPASTFLRLENHDTSGNTWLAKIYGKEGLDFLLWLGMNSSPLGDTARLSRSVPSLFVSERDRRPEAVHPYQPPWKSTRLPFDEMALTPDPGQAARPGLLRRGLSVDHYSVDELARLVAAGVSSVPLVRESPNLSVSGGEASKFHNVRVFELARRLGLHTRDILPIGEAIGVRLSSASSTMAPAQAARIEAELVRRASADDVP